MQPSLVSFVMLQFSRFPNEAVSLLVLDLKNGDRPQVWAQPNWRRKVDSDDRDYLSALIQEWRTTAPAEAPALLDELSRQTHGPLLALRRGAVATQEQRALLDGYIRQ